MGTDPTLLADVLTETSGNTPPSGSRSRRRSPSRRRWWKRGLLAFAGILVIASAAGVLLGAFWPEVDGPQLTHTVSRGDLIVSVTELGSLESSENTEIKCKVRGAKIPILWIVPSGTIVKPGDELVRLGTLEFEDRVNEVTKWAHVTRSAAERSAADVAAAELAVSEYLEGRFRSELMTLEKDLAIAESGLRTAKSMLGHSEMMAERGYASELEVDERSFAVRQAELNVQVKNVQIGVLEKHTKAMQLETLKGNLKAAKAQHEANLERSKQLADQLKLCEADLAHCFVKAEKGGMAIYPTAEPWKWAPEIEVGANVYMGQTMLLMPDLSKMQVKIAIPEDKIHRIKTGLVARTKLPNGTVEAQVSSVASVAAPGGRWTGNIVNYDTIVKLPELEGLKPGMSVEVEVIVAQYEDVLTIPVAAVIETEEGSYCWAKTPEGPERLSLEIGDTNDAFTIVEAGLTEGDEIYLNPLAFENVETDLPSPSDKPKTQATQQAPDSD